MTDHPMGDLDDHFFDDDEPGGCPNCNGEGFVASCLEEWACLYPEDGCDLCMMRCDWCSRPDAPTAPPSEPASAEGCSPAPPIHQDETNHD